MTYNKNVLKSKVCYKVRVSFKGDIEVVISILKSYFDRVICFRYTKEPRFVTKPRSSEAVEGDTVVIDCEVVGDPKPEVMWLRDWLKVSSTALVFFFCWWAHSY